jgi:hypothetical protein
MLFLGLDWTPLWQGGQSGQQQLGQCVSGPGGVCKLLVQSRSGAAAVSLLLLLL